MKPRKAVTKHPAPFEQEDDLSADLAVRTKRHELRNSVWDTQDLAKRAANLAKEVYPSVDWWVVKTDHGRFKTVTQD